MALIVSLMNRKGGVGKTTLTTLLATAFSRRTGQKIAVIDADPQLSIHKLRETETGDEKGLSVPYPIFAFNWLPEFSGDLPARRFEKLIDQLDEEYDLIFIDTPGKQEGQEVPIIVTLSDLIVVPVIASTFDVRSTLDFLSAISPILERRKQEGEAPRLLGIVNRKDRTLEFSSVNELDGIHGMEILAAHLSQRVRYKRDASTTQDLSATGSESQEFDALFEEFLSKVEVAV